MEYLFLTFTVLGVVAQGVDTMSKINHGIHFLYKKVRQIRNKNVNAELERMDILFILGAINNTMRFINSSAQKESNKKKLSEKKIENASGQKKSNINMATGMVVENVDDDVLNETIAEAPEESERNNGTMEYDVVQYEPRLMSGCCCIPQSVATNEKYDLIKYNKNFKNDNPIVSCINDINQCAASINNQLIKLNEILVNHKKKFCARFRKLRVEQTLTKLENNKKNLEVRFKYLLDIAQLLNHKDVLYI